MMVCWRVLHEILVRFCPTQLYRPPTSAFLTALMGDSFHDWTVQFMVREPYYEGNTSEKEEDQA